MEHILMTNNIESSMEKLPDKEFLLERISKTASSCWKLDIEKKDIDNWLENFKGESLNDIEYERHLALLLLSNFVYFNLGDIRHLAKNVFLKFIHDQCVIRKKEFPTDTDLNIFTQNIIKETIFCPLGNPSESGTNILYYFRQANKLPKSCFSYDVKQYIEKDAIKNIVFIDDVAITGSQASKILKEEYNLKNSNKNIYLLTFIATDTAIDKFNFEFQDTKIKILSTLQLDERSKCFSDSSYIFNEFDELRNDCKLLAEYYGKMYDNCCPLGYKNDGYAIGFFYNIPDNTLPIFWYDENGWNPIFRRYSKIYNKNGYDGVIDNEQCKYI